EALELTRRPSTHGGGGRRAGQSLLRRRGEDALPTLRDRRPEDADGVGRDPAPVQRDVTEGIRRRKDGVGTGGRGAGLEQDATPGRVTELPTGGRCQPNAEVLIRAGEVIGARRDRQCRRARWA